MNLPDDWRQEIRLAAFCGDLTETKLLSKSRERHIEWVRRMAMARIRSFATPTPSYAEIGRAFGVGPEAVRNACGVKKRRTPVTKNSCDTCIGQ